MLKLRRHFLGSLVAGVTGALLVTTSAEASPHRGSVGFQGEWRNPDGTIHLRARTYHPGLRRFLQRDTYAGAIAAPTSLNRYAFADNNPTTWSDPSGFRTRKGACLGCGLTPDDLPFWGTPQGAADAAAGAVKQSIEGAAALGCMTSPLCATSPALSAMPEAAGRLVDHVFARGGINTRGDNYSDGGTIVNSATGILTAGAGLARSAVSQTLRLSAKAGARTSWSSRMGRAVGQPRASGMTNRGNRWWDFAVDQDALIPDGATVVEGPMFPTGKASVTIGAHGKPGSALAKDAAKNGYALGSSAFDPALGKVDPTKTVCVLAVCYGGDNGVSRAIADAFEVPVTAADGPVFWTRNGMASPGAVWRTDLPGWYTQGWR
jgi:RHS repeat-associated protein